MVFAASPVASSKTASPVKYRSSGTGHSPRCNAKFAFERGTVSPA